MKGIFWKIFVPVLLAMASIVFFSLLLLASFGARAQDNLRQVVPQLYEDAKDTLLQSDEAGLKEWLYINKDLEGLRVFILDENKKDILGRNLPPEKEILRGMNRDVRNGLGNNRTEQRLRGEPRKRMGRYSDRFERKTGRYPILSSNNQHYRFLLARPEGGLLGILKSQKTFLPILLSMILLSALVSAMIAKIISQPIKKLRNGVQRISAGDLQAKISNKLSHRNDEIGALAQDFDVMTEKLSNLLAIQQKLLRDISHELRSPLARLQVALGLAEKRSGSEIAPELQRIETEVDTLNEMIGKILSLVRLNNLSIDNSEIEFKKTDLVGLLKPLIANTDYEGQVKNIVIELEAPNPVFVKAEPKLLSSAFENVFRNAIKYSLENSKIFCKLKKSNIGISVSISDSGPGIPLNDLDKIFEPFYRVSKSRAHQQGTGGIGLAITKQAIELHGGTIYAKNTESGLMIIVELPIEN